MERAVAVKKLTKLLGKSMAFEVNSKAPDEDDRNAARAELKEAVADREVVSKTMEARRQEILQADPEYQRLKAEYTVLRQRCDRLSSITRSYRFTAGTANSMFFHVRAQGDSWEEVIAKLNKEGYR